MKTISKLLTLIVCMSLFVTCGDDDGMTAIPNGPAFKVHTQTINLVGIPNFGFYTTDTIRLRDIIGYDAAQNLTDKDLQYDNTHLLIEGLENLNPSVELNNIKITVNGKNTYELGTAAVGSGDIQSGVPKSTGEVRNMMQKIFSYLTTGKKEVYIRVDYTTTSSFLEDDDISLNLVFNMEYKWNSYTK
ncbi:hypothetical protein M2138_001442 [Dysgonomonadaceae bacterium PH5-43]|nr:hypothetical protein [Dysgonomonadaceae bacterium PH5-43]